MYKPCFISCYVHLQLHFNDNNKLNPPKILFSYKLLGDPYIESTIYYNPDIQYIVSGNLHTSEGVQLLSFVKESVAEKLPATVVLSETSRP